MSRTLALWGSFSIPFQNKKTKLYNRAVYRGSRIGIQRGIGSSAGLNLKGIRRYIPAILLFGNIALAVVYFFGVNQNAAKGYELKKVTAKINQLIEDNKKLIVKTAETSSILEVQQSSSLAQFVPVDFAEYLQVNQLSQR